MFKKKFIFKENYLTIRKNSLKKRILRWNTNQSANVFLRIGDTISLDPIIKGFHEEGLSKFISYVAKNKYNDYFIDIGANIGLMSCQNKDQFKSFYMFEPNPYCFKLLEINAALNLNINKCHFFNFGLGEKNKKVKLFVPKFNWGGAFISDSNNNYNFNLLAKKDGFKKYNLKNYLTVNIEIRKTEEVFKLLFRELKNKKGVIKIDVEGYEGPILIGIAKALPLNIKTIIIFENLNLNFDMNKIIKAFGPRKILVNKLNRKLPWGSNYTGLMRSFCFKSTITAVVPVRDNNYVGDLILNIL